MLAGALIRKLEQFDRLSDAECPFLEQDVVRQRAVGRGRGPGAGRGIVLPRGSSSSQFCCALPPPAHVQAPDHSPTRAGDFVDLHSFLVKTMDHGVMAMTPCTVGVVPHEVLRAISETQPHLIRLLGLHMAVDAAIHRQWIVSIWRQSAREHAAHLLCELFLRLQVVGLTEGFSFKLPLTQAELGDTLGLSTVHVNRILQELRAEGLITWRGETLVIEDWPRLQELAEFAPTFLCLERVPR